MTAGRAAAPLVELRGVRAGYGPIEVLHGVDLALVPGEVLAVLGPNGAGKTTALNVLAGLHPLSGGDVFVAGRRVNGASATDLARAGLCLVPEGRGIFPNLSVRENLRMASHTRGRAADIEAVAHERFPRLGDRRRQVAGTLSGGEQQMLALARGLATDPAVLVLDELRWAGRRLSWRSCTRRSASWPAPASRCWWSSSSPASSSASPIAPPSCCTGAWSPWGPRIRSSPSCPRHTWVVDEP
jgi:predicted ABC-type transport system involved in lysophospholipase L1 biosynthesis ATPase subunit